jgi:hypothetical protein
MEPKIERGAAPDLHRIEDASANRYLVEALNGQGEPWRNGTAEAVPSARQVGPG